MLTTQSKTTNTEKQTDSKIADIFRRQSATGEDLLGIAIRRGAISKNEVFEYLSDAYEKQRYLGNEIMKSLEGFLQDPEYKSKTLAIMAGLLASGNFSDAEKESLKILENSSEGKFLVIQALNSKKTSDRNFERCAETIVEIFGDKSTPLITELIKNADNKDWFVSFEVKNAVAKLGHHAVEGLIEVIGSHKFGSEHFASRCIRSFPEIALPLVIDKVKNGTRTERQYAISELGFCESVPAVSEFLMQYLKDQSYELSSKLSDINQENAEPAPAQDNSGPKRNRWFSFGKTANSTDKADIKLSKTENKIADKETWDILDNISGAIASLDLLASASSITNDGRYIRRDLESTNDFDIKNRTHPNKETFSVFLSEENIFRLLVPAYLQYKNVMSSFDYSSAVSEKSRKMDPEFQSRALYQARTSFEEILSNVILNDETNSFAERISEKYCQPDCNIKQEILGAYQDACEKIKELSRDMDEHIEELRPVQKTLWNLKPDEDSFSLMPSSTEKFQHLSNEEFIGLQKRLSDKYSLITEQLPGMIFCHPEDSSLISAKLHLAPEIKDFDKAVCELALTAFRMEENDFIRSSALGILSRKMTKQEFWGLLKDILENETLGQSTRYTVNKWISDAILKTETGAVVS